MSTTRRNLKQVWIGSQSFQYDANRDRYRDNKQRVVDIRADNGVRVNGRTIEQFVFEPSGPTKVGMSDFLISKAARESGLAGVLYTSGLAK